MDIETENRTYVEILTGVSHWLPEEQPDTVAGLLLEWFAAHPYE